MKARIPSPVVKSTTATKKPSGAFKHPMLDRARKLSAEGKPKEAAEVLVELAGQLKPFERAQVLSHAATFLRVEDCDRAIALAKEATQLAPEVALGWIALSNLLDDKRDRKGAIAAALKVMEAKASPMELVDVGRQLSRFGQDAKSLEAVKTGYERSGELIALGPYTLRVALQCADWALANRITTRLRAAHAEGRTREVGETPRTHLLWCADEATNIAVISAFAEKHFPVRTPLVTAAWPGGGQRKLRIGYLSYDYRDHATSLLAMGLLRHHDRERFELFGYCTSYDDGSALRRDMLSRFDRVRTFNKVSDIDAAKRIVADKIDVLVDFNGLTEGTRHGILAWRPAPVQICYLGYPGSAGGRFVDYIVGDDYTVPAGAELLYPEKVIRIPPTYQINDYLARYLLPRAKRRPKELTQPGGPIIGMFNNVNKVSSEVWAVWMRILRAMPEATLWMLEPGEVARKNLIEAANLAGIASTRLAFAPKLKQDAHMARMQYCDLMLDPWPYGGHTTTGDALFSGVPVVALEGTNFASRVSGGLLRAAGLGQLVLTNVDAYVETALALLREPQALARIRAQLIRNRARLPIFDAPGRTRQLEAAYLEAYSRSERGLPPRHIHVRMAPRSTNTA